MFIVVSISGPLLGIIIGGLIVQKFAGGYEGKNALLYCFVFSICAFACTIPTRFADNIYAFGAILWGTMFFGGAVIPNLQGAMISSLRKQLRAPGNSISNIFQCLLGFLPAPFVYGIIYEHTENYDNKIAMNVILSYSIVGVIFIFVSMMLNYKMLKYSKN